MFKATTFLECFFVDQRRKKSTTKIFKQFFFSTKHRLVISFRLAQRYSNSPILGKLFRHIYRSTSMKTGCEISLAADIGPRIKLPHPNGVVIGQGVKIGNDTTIFQQVTLGARRLGDSESGRDVYPVVGSHVTIYAGAKLIGDLKLGDRSQIGCNAVVLKDVPAGSTAVGIPAKVISK